MDWKIQDMWWPFVPGRTQMQLYTDFQHSYICTYEFCYYFCKVFKVQAVIPAQTLDTSGPDNWMLLTETMTLNSIQYFIVSNFSEQRTNLMCFQKPVLLRGRVTIFYGIRYISAQRHCVLVILLLSFNKEVSKVWMWKSHFSPILTWLLTISLIGMSPSAPETCV